ncbi:uncharacterized protein LOC62_05G007052 [Vanrija pseudolonga]|uniref:F-box domain-containing protein n=1 Tax=Vanrija pseudolonga TaxID=143232 RepID=A0AAF0YFC3_9TREE|nr:hypothetical protein LOC62_05G007052 [Vanrija pseudolonga]
MTKRSAHDADKPFWPIFTLPKRQRQVRRAASPTPSPSEPTPAPLDSSAFPHILERVIDIADYNALLALRTTSRRVSRLVEARLYAHLVVGSMKEYSAGKFVLKQEQSFTAPADRRLPGFPPRRWDEWRPYPGGLCFEWQPAQKRVAKRLRHVLTTLDIIEPSEQLLGWMASYLDPTYVRVCCATEGHYPPGRPFAVGHTLVMFPPTQPAMSVADETFGMFWHFHPATRRVVHHVKAPVVSHQPLLYAPLDDYSAELWDATKEYCVHLDEQGCGACRTRDCKSRRPDAMNAPRGPRTHDEADGAPVRSSLSAGPVFPRHEVLVFSDPAPNLPPRLLSMTQATATKKNGRAARYHTLAVELASLLMRGSMVTLVDLEAARPWLQFDEVNGVELRDELVQATIAALAGRAPFATVFPSLSEFVSDKQAAELAGRLVFTTRTEWEAGLSAEDVAAFTVPQFVASRNEPPGDGQGALP